MTKEQLKELVQLQKENPDHELVFMTFYEVVGEDWGYWKSNSARIELGIYCHYNDEMYFDEDCLRDEISDRLYNDNTDSLPDDEFDKLVEDEYNKIEWTKAIFVYLDV